MAQSGSWPPTLENEGKIERKRGYRDIDKMCQLARYLSTDDMENQKPS